MVIIVGHKIMRKTLWKAEDTLNLGAGQISDLRRLVKIAEKLIARGASSSSQGRKGGKRAKSGKRIRRSGKELVKFRKMLKAQRKKGIPAAELARKHGVSSAYIYSLR
jgi:hypothetical protein